MLTSSPRATMVGITSWLLHVTHHELITSIMIPFFSLPYFHLIDLALPEHDAEKELTWSRTVMTVSRDTASNHTILHQIYPDDQ